MEGARWNTSILIHFEMTLNSKDLYIVSSISAHNKTFNCLLARVTASWSYELDLWCLEWFRESLCWRPTITSLVDLGTFYFRGLNGVSDCISERTKKKTLKVYIRDKTLLLWVCVKTDRGHVMCRETRKVETRKVDKCLTINFRSFFFSEHVWLLL